MDLVTRQEFWQSVIGQSDNEDYSQSGYIACYHEGRAYLTRYGHCSCYGTFEDLCGGGAGDYFAEGVPCFAWSGTKEELIDMAKRCADPHMPSRTASEDDYDYEHLVAVYQEVIYWSEHETV